MSARPTRLFVAGLCVIALLGNGCARRAPSANEGAELRAPFRMGDYVGQPLGRPVEARPWIAQLQPVDLDKDGLIDVVGCEAQRNEVFWLRQVRRGEFEEQVIAFQGVEEGQKVAEEALLDGLTAVVAEAQMDAFFSSAAAEDAVNAGGRDWPVLRRAGQVGFIDLKHGSFDCGHLLPEDIGQGQHELFQIAVMRVKQRFRQHIGAGDGEFERS